MSNTCMKRSSCNAMLVECVRSVEKYVNAKLKNIEKQNRTAYNCTYTICCSDKLRLQAAEDLQEGGGFCVFKEGGGEGREAMSFIVANIF
jgi:hypothetical protein